MLVNFRDQKNPNFFYRQDYADISHILLLVKAKALFSLFLDSEGENRVFGKFNQCDYTIEINNNDVRESLTVIIECDENTVNDMKLEFF